MASKRKTAPVAAAAKFVSKAIAGVSDVVNVDDSQVKAAPDLGSREATEHIRGLMPVADRMVVLLDIDKLIAGQLPNTTDSEDQAPAAAAA